MTVHLRESTSSGCSQRLHGAGMRCLSMSVDSQCHRRRAKDRARGRRCLARVLRCLTFSLILARGMTSAWALQGPLTATAEWMRRGTVDMLRGDTAKAALDFQHVVDSAPEDAEAHLRDAVR